MCIMCGFPGLTLLTTPRKYTDVRCPTSVVWMAKVDELHHAMLLGCLLERSKHEDDLGLKVAASFLLFGALQKLK